MTDYDVFNGDADGICALVQLRNHEPRDARLITGVKRDISLVQQITAKPGDRITVLDISMDKNSSSLNQVLDDGAEVFYVDHHFPGDIPSHPKLTSIINQAPDTCTSILVNSHLKGAFCAWAVVGAFGDNLKTSAQALAKNLSVSAEELTLLENLGIYINYNGYGAALEHLHFKPDALFRAVSAYANPLDFIRESKEDFERLETGYQQDMLAAQAMRPEIASDNSAVYILPNQAWAQRVSGVFSNDLANQYPDRAHGVLTVKDNGNYLVSVRAPLNNKVGAADVCQAFPSGGGRAAAAGINDLPASAFNEFVQALEQRYA